MLLSAWRVVFRRSLANWRLLSTVVAGVVLAVALLASAPLYADAINALGLSHALKQRPREIEDIQIIANYYPMTRPEYEKVNSFVQGLTQSKLGPVTRQRVAAGKTSTFYISDPVEAERLVPALTTVQQTSDAVSEARKATALAEKNLETVRTQAEESGSAESRAALETATQAETTSKQNLDTANRLLQQAQDDADKAQRALTLARRVNPSANETPEQRNARVRKAEDASQQADAKVQKAQRQLLLAQRDVNMAELRAKKAKRDAEASRDANFAQKVTEGQAKLDTAKTDATDPEKQLKEVRAAADDLLKADTRNRGFVQFREDAEQHLTLVAGRFAKPVEVLLDAQGLPAASPELEVVIGAQAAADVGVSLGDRLVLVPHWQDVSSQVTAQVVGIVERADPSEEYWLLDDPLVYPPSEGQTWRTAPLLAPFGTFFDGMGRLFPAGSADSYKWYVYIDPDRITTRNARSVEDNVQKVGRETITSVEHSMYLTVLNDVLSDYRTKLIYTRVPIFLVLLQVVGIILYYVVMVASMLVERRSSEISLLKSRGASTMQIVTIHFMEGLLVCGVAALVGPFLAAGATSLMGKTGAFRPLSGGGLLQVQLTPLVFALAGAAAFVSLLALLFPAFGAARFSSIQQRQQASRPQRAPFWQRYYLDLVFLGLGAVLYWQAHSRGNILGRTVLGELTADPFQLINPALLMIAVAILFLRLFPLLLAGLSRLVTAGAQVPVILGLRYMGRNPVHYTRLILLLILATALGLFAATLGGTLNRSQVERTYYQVGADLRMEGLSNYFLGKEALLADYRQMPQIQEASAVWRGEGSSGSFQSIGFNMLGVDPNNFEKLVWYRSDFSTKSLPMLMKTLLRNEPSGGDGLLLPATSRRLGLWAQPTRPCDDCTVVARLTDSKETYFSIELGDLSSSEWRFLEGDIADPKGELTLSPPFQLLGVFLRIGSQSSRNREQTVYLDDIQVTGDSDQKTVVEGFENVDAWEVTRPPQQRFSGDSFDRETENVHSGKGSARFIARAGGSGPGFRFKRATPPFLAVASSSFLKASNARVGDSLAVNIAGRPGQVEIAEVVDYFPTMDPVKRPFLVVNINQLTRSMNRMLDREALYPNEVWLQTDAHGNARAELVTALTPQPVPGAAKTPQEILYHSARLDDQSQILQVARSDPLMAAGWRGVLGIAFLAVVLISALGFLVYSYLSAQKRQLEFAVLRTMGLSRGQILGLVFFEQALVIGMGMIAGTAIGIMLSRMMIPFVQLTELGERVLPPFLITIDWGGVTRVYVVMLAVFLLASSVTVWFFARLAIHRALRIGE
ncbi:MAG: FtsX-like permease family protein [Chloroflexi bacterium]|nr:FtsX-like permease family protein [Chloroflexota bacterium]